MVARPLKACFHKDVQTYKKCGIATRLVLFYSRWLRDSATAGRGIPLVGKPCLFPKPINTGLSVVLSGAYDYVTELRVIYSIGILLGFQYERAAETKYVSIGTFLLSKEEVSAVELQSGLV